MSDNLRNVICYDSNNSGGSWWLSDEDWHGLAAAGWVVHWIHDPAIPHGDLVHPPARFLALGSHCHNYADELVAVEPTGLRWLRALATSAAKQTEDPAAAIREWASITGQTASDEGCNCCGSPHRFVFHDGEGKSRYTSVEVVGTELRWSE